MKQTTNPKAQVYSHKTRVILSSFKSISMILFIGLLLQNCAVVMNLFPTAGKKDNKFLLLPLALQGGLQNFGTGGTGSGSGTGATDGTGSGSGTGTGTGTTPAAPIPVASPAAGHYNTPQTIDFSTTASGGVVRCTTDGSDPTSATPAWTPRHIYSIAGLTIKCGTFANGALTGTIQTFTYSYPPLKTGQTTSYEAGDDGATQLGVERSYTDNGDGTVTDNATGLFWQKCLKGQGVTDCSGSPADQAWSGSANYCSELSLAGKTWRLPSPFELESLIVYNNNDPTIDINFFPNAGRGNYFSSHEYGPFSDYSVWSVNFLTGELGAVAKTFSYVRCVSGQVKPVSTFKDNDNETVTDLSTGLVWQKCNLGESGQECQNGVASPIRLSIALTSCSELTLAGKTWRLPNAIELSSIVDKSFVTSPSIKSTFFKKTISNFYWGSTLAHSSYANKVWVINFSSGYSMKIFSYEPNYAYYPLNYVRCVSGP
ncbi:MAG: DUF1566 domain-containing protein [Leptospiraceae bacterium]|nr:DUF1566 domain-containing protein [Leptospiraceae bacterium]